MFFKIKQPTLFITAEAELFWLLLFELGLILRLLAPKRHVI